MAMLVRPFLLLALLGLVPVTCASWTATIVHPNAEPGSTILSGSGSQQVGFLEGGFRAALWQGSAASFANLHPAGATVSKLHATNGSIQVGFATIDGKDRAGIWSGSAGSFTPLASADNSPSRAFGVYGSTQVGRAVIDGKWVAVKWTGTPGSMVNLNPPDSGQSEALCAYGNKQAGNVSTNIYPYAALWSGTAASYVDLNPGAASSSVYAMTATKQAGAAWDGDQTMAVVWSGTKESAVFLNPEDSIHSTCWGAFEDYQVGEVQMMGEQVKATLWKGTIASMVDLHQYLPTNYTRSSANAMWSHNGTLYIGGVAFNSLTSKQEAVIWTEVGPNGFSFTLNKTQVAGQNSVQGTLTPSTAFPQARVYTTYDNSSLVDTPPTVTLPANATVKNFQITVTAVNSTINTTIFAKFGAVTQSVPLALIPLVPTALAFTPSEVVGGNSVSCRVVINGVAGPGGRTIAILDNSPNATVPATVTVPPGATQVIFNIATTPVTSQKTVTVTARVSAGEKTGTFRIVP